MILFSYSIDIFTFLMSDAMESGHLDQNRTWGNLVKKIMEMVWDRILDLFWAFIDKIEGGKKLSPKEREELTHFMKKTGIEPLSEDVVEGNE